MKSHSICSLCLFLVVSVRVIKIYLFHSSGGSTGHEGLAELLVYCTILQWCAFVAVIVSVWMRRIQTHSL